jgi:hypothetical protein
VSEIDAMPYIDSVMLLETLYAELKARSSFEAALHDKKLR